MGGAQAVAALAYGTETVRPVDVIAGPGNLYVQEAKRQVSGDVGIDGFAGPSDLFVIAGADADPEPVALDLLAQTEHGAGSLVVGASPAPEVLDELQPRLDAGAEHAARSSGSSTCPTSSLRSGWPRRSRPSTCSWWGVGRRRWRRGCPAPVACSSGPRRAPRSATTSPAPTTSCRPTGPRGSRRACRPRHFRRRFTEVHIGDDAGGLARAAAPIARAEGFELHARSMEARIRDNART